MKNKILKKIIGLKGYKLIEKNSFKNNRTLSKNTLININSILEFIFCNHSIKSHLRLLRVVSMVSQARPATAR